ncbi:MAG: winged helix-turn-helix domain-containing protein [Pseudomonadota bacterium]
MNTPPKSVLKIGPYELDFYSGQLLLDGQTRKLRPKSMAVLQYLAQRPGQLTSKREILDAVWGAADVGEGALTQCIIDIRRALGAHRDCLQTLPRRGYLLEPGSATKAPSARRARLHWSGVAAAFLVVFGVVAAFSYRPDGGASRPIRLLLAPIQDATGDPMLAHLGQSVIYELRHLLAGELDVEVVMPPHGLRPQAEELLRLAEQSSAAYLLTGSMDGTPDALHVQVGLTGVERGLQTWSHRFEVSHSDWASLRRQLGVEVAAALRLDLVAGASLASSHQNSSWLQFQRGKFYYDRRQPGDVDRALAIFQEAVRLDPSYGDAWVGLLATHRMLDKTASDPDLALAMERVATLAVDSAEAHIRLSRIYADEGLESQSRAHLESARQLDPGNWLVLNDLATRAFASMAYDAGLSYLQRSVEADPLNPVARANYLSALAGTRNLTEAAAQVEALSTLSDYHSISPELLGLELKFLQGTITESDERLLSQAPWPDKQGLLMKLRATRGDRSVLLELPDDATLSARGIASAAVIGRAELLVLLGEEQQALELVQTLAGEVTGIRRLVRLSQVNLSAELAVLRDHPDWPQLDESNKRDIGTVSDAVAEVGSQASILTKANPD